MIEKQDETCEKCGLMKKEHKTNPWIGMPGHCKKFKAKRCRKHKSILPCPFCRAKNHSPGKLRKLQILGASINVSEKEIKKRKYLSTLKMYQKRKIESEGTSKSLSDKIVFSPNRRYDWIWTEDVKNFIKELREAELQLMEAHQVRELINNLAGEELI